MFSEFRKLIVPNIISNLSVPLVSLVDVGIMGHLSNSSYIISIGLGVTIFNFLFWSFGFLRMSTTGLIANSFGKSDWNKLSDWTLRSLLIAFFLGLVIILFQKPIVELAISLMRTNETVSNQIELYLSVRIWSAPATLLSYVFLGWFIGIQNSRLVLFFNLILNASNILISYGLVYFFEMEIEGVAYGSLIAQYLAIFLTTPILLKRIKFANSLKTALGNKYEWLSLFKLNGDIFVRTLCLISVLSFIKIELASEPNDVGAANVLLLEFVTIAAYFIDAIAYAAEAICGKYLGKGSRKAFFHSKRISFQLGLLCALVLTIIYYFFGDFILNQLTNKVQLVEIANPYTKYLVVFPVVAIWAFIWDGIFIGISASSSMRNSMLISSILFILVYILFNNNLGNDGKWLSLLVFMLSRGIIQFFQFNNNIKNKLVFKPINTS